MRLHVRYGRSLFFISGWMKLMKIDPKNMKKEGMTGKMVAHFIATLVMTFVLAHAITFMQLTAVTDSLMLGFFIWLGFFATAMLGQVLWEGKPAKLYAINILHHLVVLLVASAILAVM